MELSSLTGREDGTVSFSKLTSFIKSVQFQGDINFSLYFIAIPLLQRLEGGFTDLSLLIGLSA